MNDLSNKNEDHIRSMLHSVQEVDMPMRDLENVIMEEVHTETNYAPLVNKYRQRARWGILLGLVLLCCFTVLITIDLSAGVSLTSYLLLPVFLFLGIFLFFIQWQFMYSWKK